MLNSLNAELSENFLQNLEFAELNENDELSLNLQSLKGDPITEQVYKNIQEFQLKFKKIDSDL